MQVNIYLSIVVLSRVIRGVHSFMINIKALAISIENRFVNF